MPEPSWDTPARLNGLPAPSRKRRAETTRTGTMAEMIEVWLGLPHHRQRDCDIGWGPNTEGQSGTMGAETIRRYVERKKLPPQMAARYQNAAAAMAAMLNIPSAEFRPVEGRHISDGACLAVGYGNPNGK